jgi:hypothetical protein
MLFDGVLPQNCDEPRQGAALLTQVNPWSLASVN